MKKNKAFTLVELLGVITLLSIILTITFSVISNVIKDSREKTYDSQISTITNAAKRYVSDNIQNMIKDNDNFVTIKNLQEGGYINSKNILKNPINNRTMTGCIVVSYSDSYNQFNYLYTDYYCKNSSVFTPKITISDSKDVNGMYTVTITYPSNIVGTVYNYQLGNREAVTVTGNEVKNLKVNSGTKIIAQIKKGEYLVREAVAIS
jgi:prepilin-type N-terminal cleavage/methylation domain-containing protein